MNPTLQVHHGDCRETLASIEPDTFHSCVTDPPYELGFMGRKWDASGVAFDVETWRAVYRVLKPGAYLLAFGGTRTYHRMTCAIEDAGFEIRDCIMWLYGSGFPKSLDVGKAIDKAAGAAREVVGRMTGRAAQPRRDFRGGRLHHGGTKADADFSAITAPATDAAKEWDGWGTALKPAYEPIIVARKPMGGTVAENVQAYGTGGINIDACRVELDPDQANKPDTQGRWPANVIHDGSEEVVAAFPAAPGQIARSSSSSSSSHKNQNAYGEMRRGLPENEMEPRGDSGSAARFFYSAKASKSDRGEGNIHTTVKPQSLMRYLVRLVTKPGGHVLDCFAGSGTTARAAIEEGMSVTACELDPAHCDIIRSRTQTQLGLPL